MRTYLVYERQTYVQLIGDTREKQLGENVKTRVMVR